MLLSLAWFLLPAAALAAHPLPFLLVAQFLTGLGWALPGVNHASIGQALTPQHLLGRVTAARRFLVFGTSAAGAAAGGVLGGTLGFGPTLVIAAGFSLLSPVLLALSPVRRLITFPGRASPM